MDTIQITQAIRELRQKTVGELREKYIEVFGEANRSRNRDYLIRRVSRQNPLRGGRDPQLPLGGPRIPHPLHYCLGNKQLHWLRKTGHPQPDMATFDEAKAWLDQQFNRRSG